MKLLYCSRQAFIFSLASCNVVTNGFSKKVDNLQTAVALHFMYYNFCKVHGSIRMTPAMKAHKASRVFEIADILGLLHGIDPQGTTQNPLTVKALYGKCPHYRKPVI